MRILLIGRTGQLGGDLLRNNMAHEIVAPDRETLDLDRPERIGRMLEAVKPEVVINCAAFHNLARCEEEPERAFKINCTAVMVLAEQCGIHNARLVTFSTDYVFDGHQRKPYREDAPASALQIYGFSRRAGEMAALAVTEARAMVVRTCGLYGRSGATSKGGNFVDNRVADGQRGDPIEISHDQTVSPTSTHDLSRAVLALIAHPRAEPGVYHLVNDGECTWYEFTRAIFDYLQIRTELRPVDRKGRSGRMRRPLYSALANTRARSLGITLPPWRDALKCYLDEKYGRASVA